MKGATLKAVGARELKTRLGAYLALVRRGNVFVVTERGLPVAELRPVKNKRSDLDSVLREMIALGEASRQIDAPLDRFKPIRVRGGSVSATILNNREDRFR